MVDLTSPDPKQPLYARGRLDPESYVRKLVTPRFPTELWLNLVFGRFEGWRRIWLICC